jgi:WD40 repeat protein
LNSQTLTDTWEKRDWYVHWVTLDAHDRPIAIISDTQTIELWELDTNTCRATVSLEAATVWHISTSPDGAALVCATQNGEIGIWSLIDGSPQGQMRVDRPYEGMQIGGCQGITDSEREMLYSLGATDY